MNETTPLNPLVAIVTGARRGWGRFDVLVTDAGSAPLWLVSHAADHVTGQRVIARQWTSHAPRRG